MKTKVHFATNQISESIMVFYVTWLFVWVSMGILISAAAGRFPTSCPYTSKEWHILDKKKHVGIIFNPCGFLPENICGPGQQACLKNGSTVTAHFNGSNFLRGTHGSLVLDDTKRHCSLTILPECSGNFQEEPTLRDIVPCRYEVKLPSLMCPECTFMYHDHLIDLRPLKRQHLVKSTNKTFSISLCGINTNCGKIEASSCDITDTNKIIPLSSVNEYFRYDEKQKQIVKHGNFKGTIPGMGEKIVRKFELIIKCDWNTPSSEIHYKEFRIQGKNYKFEMKSSHACVKEPPTCEVADKFYIYNLTSLHNNTNWKMNHGDEQVILNICGSLQPTSPLETENHCSGSASQVCWIKDKEYINMGSIQTELIVANDIVTTTFVSGDTCEEDPTDQYSTYIEFRCSETEEYPKFKSFKRCCLVLTWNTPAACPSTNKESCENIPHIFLNTTIEISNNIYNLSTLYKKNGKHSLKNEKIEYMLNIGGPVFDDDAPCKKNMVVALKNLTAYYDVRHRVKSLGHMKFFFENDKGQLVLENDGGDFSTQYQNYYRSTIIFECCSKENCEESIKLLSKTDFTFKFVWKTPAACPTKISPSRCLFKRAFDNDYLYDFSTMKKTDLSLNISGSLYLFDICQNDRSKCDKKGCTYVSAEKSLVTYENRTHMEFTLNRTCGINVFNKALFELVCDRILNNDHFEFKALEECTLLFQLKTHQACSEEELFVSVNNGKVKKESPTRKYSPGTQYVGNDGNQQKSKKIEIYHQLNPNPDDMYTRDLLRKTQVSRRNLDNCRVVNHNTGYEFNISNLKLNVSSLECPKIVFDDSKKSVILEFSSNYPCGKSETFSHNIVMKCRSGAFSPNTTKRGHCLETFTTELPEACKLLEKTILNDNRFSYGEIAGMVVGIVAAIVFLVVFTLVFRKYRVSKERNSYLRALYVKVE